MSKSRLSTSSAFLSAVCKHDQNVLREAEKESKDVWEDLPLYQIEAEFGQTEAGKLGS